MSFIIQLMIGTSNRNNLYKDNSLAKNALAANILNIRLRGAVVVAQLVEWSLLTPEIRGSDPNIDRILSTTCKFK